MLFLADFINPVVGEKASYKGIPIQYEKGLRQYFKDLGYKVTFRYRGCRNHPLDTRCKSQRNRDVLKQFASTFAIYRR